MGDVIDMTDRRTRQIAQQFERQTQFAALAMRLREMSKPLKDKDKKQ